MEDVYQQTMYGLLKKRGELTSEIEAHRAQCEVLMLALERIDNAIRVFRPELDTGDLPERPAPPPSAAFRGEVQRFLLDMLRREGPQTTLQAAQAVMTYRRLDPRDTVLVSLIRKRTGHAMSRLRRSGFVTGVRYGSGAEMEWSLTDRGASGAPVGGWRNGSTAP